MPLPLLALAVVAALVLGYTLYGRLVARQFALDDRTETPAVRVNDGVDFVPAKPFYLLGQHLSAIAAAGPIAGPILACTQFGWLPCILWIVVGVVTIGSVHDFAALVASIRHDAKSIAEIVRHHLGPRAWLGIMAFIWIALIYVIVAFTDITAATFLGRGENVEGATSFDKGGAVAAASTAYLALAIVLGLVQRWLKPPLWLVTLLFVPATLGCVWLGTLVSTAFVGAHTTWAVSILVYCFVASLLPVWLLLQPRGYLGGFVLYLAMAVGIVGIFFGGFEVRQPATTSAPIVGMQGSLFPFLFVTIACGACSGFHGLVCSGTTSKQISRETHCRPVGYGAMLLEALVAVIALATIMIVAPKDVGGRKAGTIYGDGIAEFLSVFLGGGSKVFTATFGAMVFSTFVFDTLDVATRLGRYILQELTGLKGLGGAAIATGLTAGVPLAILLSVGEGAYLTFWVLFGTSNQLLAGLTLLAITVWLKRSGKRYGYTLAPMLFVMAITLWSLTAQAIEFFGRIVDETTGRFAPAMLANGIVAVLLVGLTALLVFEALRGPRRTEGSPA
jgi:carbon starvation protein